MKNLKNLLAAISLTAVLMIGATTANAGLLMSDLTGHDGDPCSETSNVDGKGVIVTGLTGVIVTGFTGVIVTGYTGVIVTGYSDDPVNCGIMLSD